MSCVPPTHKILCRVPADTWHFSATASGLAAAEIQNKHHYLPSGRVSNNLKTSLCSAWTQNQCAGVQVIEQVKPEWM
ncbi:hypothetical protein E2320_010723 [Naja naja]|nr:hypothetical protein E2320_010723 [Naja naja]